MQKKKKLLLDFSQYIITFLLHQSLCSNLVILPKLTKILHECVLTSYAFSAQLTRSYLLFAYLSYGLAKIQA